LFDTNRCSSVFDRPMLLQAALADFIEDGHFARHLRRMRKTYGERAAALAYHVDKSARGLIRLRKPEAGLHSVAWVSPGADDKVVARLAAQKGVESRALSVYGRRKQEAG